MIIKVLTFIFGLLAIGWLLAANDIAMQSFFGVAKENVKREIFEQSQSYVEGKRQDLEKYRFEYITSKDEIEKEAIRSLIFHSFANVNDKLFEGESYKFLHAMRNNKSYGN